MYTQQQFDNIESKYGCGYYNMCTDRGCPCAVTTENKGLQLSIYKSFLKEQEEARKELNL